MLPILVEIMKNLRAFIYLPSIDHYLVVALFVLLSYCQEEFDAVPYLHLVAQPDSGKSTLLKIIELLSHKAEYELHITDAAICRLINKKRGMFILDDAEALGCQAKSSFLLSILLNGYKKGGAVTVCDRSDPFGVISYKVFGVKVTANTKGIADPALLTRYIIIRMSKPEGKSLRRFYLASDSEIFKRIASDLRNLFEKHENGSLKTRIQKTYLSLGEIEGLTNRDYERFAPLLTLAKVTDEESGKKIFNTTLAFATKYIKERNEEDFFTHLPTMVIFSVWKYVEPLLESSDLAENKYFWAEKICDHVRKDLRSHFENLHLEFGVKKLGKLLDLHNILLGPEKRKIRRVRFDEDIVDAKKLATHFHLDVDKLKLFANESGKYIDLEEPPMSDQRLEEMNPLPFIKKVRDRYGRKSKDSAEPKYLHREKWGDW